MITLPREQIRQRALAIQQARAQVLNAMPAVPPQQRQLTPSEAVVVDAGQKLQAQGFVLIYHMREGTGEFTGFSQINKPGA